MSTAVRLADDNFYWIEFPLTEKGEIGADNRVQAKDILEAASRGKLVHIRNAVIDGPLKLTGGRLVREFELLHCRVEEPCSLSHVHFDLTVSLTDTVFLQTLDFTGSTFAQDFEGTRIQCGKSQAIFRSVNVLGRCYANEAAFSDLDFEAAAVQGHAFFSRCNFGDTNFVTASFGGFTDFTGASFTKPASFVSASFQGHLMFDEIKASGSLDFTFAKVGAALSMNRSHFEAGLAINSAVLEGTFQCQGVTFGPSSTFSCFRTRVRGQAFFRNCRFQGEVNFSKSSFADEFEFDDVVLHKAAAFDQVQVGRDALFGHMDDQWSYAGRSRAVADRVPATDEKPNASVIFKHKASFSEMNVAGSLHIQRVLFAGTADFKTMKIAGGTSILQSRFEAMPSQPDEAVEFNRSEFFGILGCNSIFERPAHFYGIRTHAAVRFLDGCEFQHATDFYFSDFEDEVNFGGARLAGELGLRNARFRRALLFQLKFPERATVFDDFPETVPIDLRGCSYDLLGLPGWDKDLSLATVKQFLERMSVPPRYNRIAFLSLERFFRRVGASAQANAVRMFWSSHEHKNKSIFSLGWWWDSLQLALTGYGTRLLPIFIVTVLAALFAQVFRSPLMGHAPAGLRKLLPALQLSLAGSLVVLTPLLLEGFRRRFWPEDK